MNIGLFERLMKYKMDYDFYEYKDTIGEDSPDDLLKPYYRKQVIEELKEDLAETDDICQVHDAVDLIIMLNDLERSSGCY
jgi:hypothetical protein